MNLQIELNDLLRLEQWAARLPQAVADCNGSAAPMARIVARKYNGMFNLYPVTARIESSIVPPDMTPRLVRKIENEDSRLWDCRSQVSK